MRRSVESSTFSITEEHLETVEDTVLYGSWTVTERESLKHIKDIVVYLTSLKGLVVSHI